MPKAPSAEEKPVKDIFSRNYLFNIPGYQRPYAWTSLQTRDLFDDLWGFLQQNPPPNPENQKEVDEAPTYFLGSIVLIKEKDRAEATVVDGQQRLTTLTILLSALRDRVPAPASGAIGEFIYEQGNIIAQLPDRFRLRLRDLDQKFFQKYVQRQDGFRALVSLDSASSEIDTDAKQHIWENARVLAEKVNALSPEQAQSLAISIANRCYIVAVSTADFRSAFRIFSVLNSRGLDLGPTDILKARLLESVAETAQSKSVEITAAWEEMEVDLGREGFLELFTHVRAIFKKSKARESLLDELTSELKTISPVKFFTDTLPQTPSAQSLWLQWFPSIEEREYWTHRIANLVLLAKSINSSARNFEFDRKKSSYFVRRGVTTFALTVPVLAHSEWTPNVLQERQSQLIAVLKQHWRLA